MEEKYYKVSESKLLDLLEAYVRLNLLDRGGVDNWRWYGEGWSTWLRNWAKKLNPEENYENEDIYIDDVARMLLNLYEKI